MCSASGASDDCSFVVQRSFGISRVSSVKLTGGLRRSLRYYHYVSDIFVQRNLRPYFKFTAPLVEPSDEEADLWTRYRKDDVDADTLKMLLAKVQLSYVRHPSFFLSDTARWLRLLSVMHISKNHAASGSTKYCCTAGDRVLVPIPCSPKLFLVKI